VPGESIFAGLSAQIQTGQFNLSSIYCLIGKGSILLPWILQNLLTGRRKERRGEEERRGMGVKNFTHIFKVIFHTKGWLMCIVDSHDVHMTRISQE
jgi:hypothetical protein